MMIAHSRKEYDYVEATFSSAALISDLTLSLCHSLIKADEHVPYISTHSYLFLSLLFPSF